MAAAQGKSCEDCMMCCIVLEIDIFDKPAGPACKNCAFPGCRIYQDRPQVCRDFECEWLTSRTLPQNFRPDRIGAILMEDADTGQYQAVCAPERPHVWRNPRVLAHLVAMAKAGHTVVAKAGTLAWRVFPTGETAPTV